MHGYVRGHGIDLRAIEDKGNESTLDTQHVTGIDQNSLRNVRSAFIRLVSACALASLVGSMCSCGITHPEDFPSEGPTLKATSNPAAVSSDDFGRSWNLDVDNGIVSCDHNDDGDPVLTFEAPDGTVYALNGVEGTEALPDVGEIADGSVGYLRTFAFTVCDVDEHE